MPQYFQIEAETHDGVKEPHQIGVGGVPNMTPERLRKHLEKHGHFSPKKYKGFTIKGEVNHPTDIPPVAAAVLKAVEGQTKESTTTEPAIAKPTAEPPDNFASDAT